VSLIGRRNRLAAAVTGAAGAVAVLVAWVAVGSDGPLSAFLGAVLVVAFFSAGSLPFAVAGDGTQGRSGLAFLVLGMTYVLRVLVGVAAYQVASRSDRVDMTVVGLSVIACALVWVNTQLVLGLQRRHQPTLDL
jgi:hypothetical protein